MLLLVINKNLKGINLTQELLKLKMLGLLKIIKLVGEKYHNIEIKEVRVQAYLSSIPFKIIVPRITEQFNNYQ